jgi:N-acetylglucosamine-6-sulfatase
VHDEHDGRPTTYSYSVWCTGERELYDLVSDPHQVCNLLAPLNAIGLFASFDATATSVAGSTEPVLSKHLQSLLNRLDGLLLVLKTCIGDACREPYRELFPSGKVYRLSQALEPRFDAYFAGLPKVRFSECALGYQARLEKPEWQAELAFVGHEVSSVAGETVFTDL